jgi:hypothetical protein
MNSIAEDIQSMLLTWQNMSALHQQKRDAAASLHCAERLLS